MNFKLDRTEQFDLPEENWKQIEGFGGVYQISNKGRLKTHKQGKTYWTIGGKTPQKYLRAQFCINGKVVKQTLIHDLVAENFIRKFDYKTEIVHHISGDKTENNVQNLKIEKRDEHTSHHKKGTKRTQKKGF